MKYVMWLLKGGFLEGYRTKVLGWGTLIVSVVNVLSAWMVGDMTMMAMMEAVKQYWEALVLGGGLLTSVYHADNMKVKHEHE